MKIGVLEMKETKFIRAADDKPSTTAGSAPVSVALPPDFLEAASHRLGLAALLYAVTYLIAYGTGRLTHNFEEWFPGSHLLVDVSAAFSIGLALGVYFLVRSARFAPQFLLDIGLLFWVVSALGIDLGMYYEHLSLGSIPNGLSWICVWLVLFPLIVPGSPGKILLAAFTTASMGPFAFLVALVMTESAVPEQVSLLNLFLPYYLSAGLALAGSRIIYKLGCEVSRAREMGSYRLVKLLGRGGMGEVWLAKHKLLARPAAIKLLKAETLGRSQLDTASNKVLLKRFEREAQATAALRSPHTVQLYDFGTTEDGTFYYAMEFLEGLDLEQLIERFGPAPAARAIYFMKQICDSLDEAHQRGLVHRDIKPSNVYLSRLGRYHDFVKVLDFGLVKRHHEMSRNVTRLTVEGVTAGTPAYMAPEIALGSGEIHAAADIYSLGCLGYWLLTGRLVFEGKTPMEIAVQHIQATPVAPSERTEMEIPDDLERIILSCLQKKPEERPHSVRNLASRLTACRDPEPWNNDRAEQWWKLHQPETASVKPIDHLTA
jgi:eukaryotic-like serine/threonine-protein kinase